MALYMLVDNKEFILKDTTKVKITTDNTEIIIDFTKDKVYWHDYVSSDQITPTDSQFRPDNSSNNSSR